MTTTIILPVTAHVANERFEGFYGGNAVLNADTGPLGGITVVPPGVPFMVDDDDCALALVSKHGGQVLEGGNG